MTRYLTQSDGATDTSDELSYGEDFASIRAERFRSLSQDSCDIGSPSWLMMKRTAWPSGESFAQSSAKRGGVLKVIGLEPPTFDTHGTISTIAGLGGFWWLAQAVGVPLPAELVRAAA